MFKLVIFLGYLICTLVNASPVQRYPFKFEISTHYLGVSSWVKYNDHFLKGSYHINRSDAFGNITYNYAHLALLRLGSLLNETTSDLTLNHFFLTQGICVLLTPKPYQLSGYYFNDYKKLSARYGDFGASVDREESAINSDFLTTLSVFGSYKIESYKTTISANFWNLIPSDTDSLGYGLKLETKTIVMLNKNPHRVGMGNMYYSWKEPLVKTVYFEPDDYLFSFYDQLRQKRFKSTESLYLSYETSTTIEKTRLYFDMFAYTTWNLFLTKLTIEYPLDYNLGLLTQLFYSTGLSNYGVRVNVIWKY
jgi:hypothetical protein